MPANNYTIHYKNILKGKRILIRKNALQKGMIVDARYRALDEEGKPSNIKKYMLLILNPGYKGKTDTKRKVHALTLNNFTPMILNKLAEKVGLVYIPKFKKMISDSLSLKSSTTR